MPLTDAQVVKIVEEMQEDIDELKSQKQDIFAETETPMVSEELQLRYEFIEPLLNKLVTAHKKVKSSLDEEEQTSWKRGVDKFKKDYFALQGAIKKRMRELDQQSATVVTPVQAPQSKVSFKPPKIDLMTFDGTYETWTKFHDFFEAMVHKNPSLSNIEKFHYLETAMKLPATQGNVLKNYSMSEDNYEAAWQAVCDRYADQRKIVAFHCAALINLKKMTGESAAEVRRILDTVMAQLSALEQQGYMLDDADDFANMILLQLVIPKLHEDTTKEWRKHIGTDCVTWVTLEKFLIAQWRSLDEISPNKKLSAPEVKPNTKSSKTMVSNTSREQPTCFICSEAHGFWKCDKFKQMSVDERQKVVREKKRCLNCLGSGHQVKDCPSKHLCKTCNQRHNSWLHYEKSSAGNSSGTWQKTHVINPSAPAFEPYNMTRESADDRSFSATSCSGAAATFVSRQHTLLSTVEVQVEDVNGEMHPITVLLDQGSDTNHISARAVKLLNLRCDNAHISLSGIGDISSVVTQTTKAVIHSRYGPFRMELEFSVLPTITGFLPSQRVKVSDLAIPQNTFLADPKFHVPKQVDMLLNNEVFCQSLLDGKISLPSGPTLIRTKFGWIIGGTIKGNPQPHRSLLSCFSHSNVGVEVIDEKLEKFFAMEDFDSSGPTLTPEEKYCEELYKQTTTRGEDGKFIVQLPFKSNHQELGNNINNAYRMLHAQESRRKKDDNYNRLYIEYMKDLIDSGHMREVQPDGTFAHYLPHHGVVKMSSTTTKLRPVCNASSKSETGLSLNDVMCSGPVVQPEMFDILLRARESEFVIMADITKMYRQIWVHPSQRKYQRLLWRADPNTEKIKHYEMQTVTFGTTCAPFLATRTVMEIAANFKDEFPEASKIIEDSSYVDDFFFSFKSIEQGVKIRDQLRYMFVSHGMLLCKFASNAPEILAELPGNLVESSPEDDEKSIIKTLGIVCDLKTDEFAYRLKPIAGEKLTKAAVLSEIASIYDPIGWIGPVILRAKIFMKRLWLLNLDWKDQLPEPEREEWQEFREDFPALSAVRIKRHCYVKDPVTVEVHGFSDASIEAYGAAIYVRSTDKDGTVQVSLVCAKSRVAPKKQKSLARLELCGALLAARLVTRIVKILSYPIDEVIIWCDSTIVLNWITMLSSKLQTFVGNRVAAIQELSDNIQWNHISGSDNPADIISRGLKPQEIQNCAMWWNGPTFFYQPKQSWPKSIITVNETDPEVAHETKRVSLTTRQQSSLFNKIENHYSELSDLILHFGLMRRFIQNLKTPDNESTGPLTVDEERNAELAIIRVVQQALYPSEYEILSKQREILKTIDTTQLSNNADGARPEIPQITRQSPLIALMPFLDDDGVIRVGGRLQNCQNLTFDQQHQIVIPQSGLAEMIVRKNHFGHHHPTLQTLHNILRQKYWIIRAKPLIKKVTRFCVKCFRVNPPSTDQLMAPLPRARVTMTPPFTHSALDYAGFYLLKSGTTRNAPITKVYVALFKCMCTGAIHLDLAADLSSIAFISTLDRFISRRGLCEEIFSDNATCFEGADNELKEIVKKNDPQIHHYCKTNQIRWNFTTPRAPHAGGIYESGIKQMKHHLKRIVGDRHLTFEHFQTVLCKIEAVLNSRPITPMSDDPNDLQALTPGHFLIGRPLVAKPERNYLPSKESSLNKWAQVQQLQQQFWSAWYHDYLHTLQTRPKNFQEKVEFQINDMVILKDSNLPPLKWIVGRIIKLYPDKTKVVRNVRVQTPTGEKDRHVKYLCLLPTEK